MIIAAILAAITVEIPPTMAGIWSLGDTKDCASGPAWVFLTDGYYAEVQLPDKGPFATGL